METFDFFEVGGEGVVAGFGPGFAGGGGCGGFFRFGGRVRGGLFRAFFGRRAVVDYRCGTVRVLCLYFVVGIGSFGGLGAGG